MQVRQLEIAAVGSPCVKVWCPIISRPSRPSCLLTPCPPHPQIDKPEIRLRRTITAKKDDYTLDKKHIKCGLGRRTTRVIGMGTGARARNTLNGTA